MFLVETARQKPEYARSVLSAFARCIAIAAFVLAFLAAGYDHAEARPRLAAMAVDARTGKILYAKDADGLRYPASLTKVMTLYVLFQDLKAGRVKLGTKLRVSRRAAAMAPSKLGMKPGTAITVEDAIKALVTKSANDVAATIAENLASSEPVFASRMTKVARSLGMRRTAFRNASGLPARGQITTARDMAILSLRIQRDFPQYYPYFRLSSFVYKGRVIRTHNRLLGRFDGTDGIKTGYTREAGFNLTSSVRRGGKRVVGVVLGASSSGARNGYMMKMLSAALPSCVAGSTIVAAPGSKAGAIDPIAALKQKTAVAAAKPKAPEPREIEEAKVVTLPAEVLAGGTDEDAAETGSSSDEPVSDQGVGTDEPRVLEAMISSEPQPQTDEPLPFAVKDKPDAGGQVLVQISPSAWKIQLGAYPNKQAAQATLERALSNGASVLEGKQAFTATAQNGNETIYRARFSGFSRDGARAACRHLESKGMACLPLAPQS
ncbi:MAG: D-alanyl-D-alanine carboxypeptidase [Rhizobiales bacterium]|nr:D-alanyl-D-alanine carboxypeptidase [Hyphomicrobiales bacterium]